MKSAVKTLSNAWAVFRSEGANAFWQRTRLKIRKILRGNPQSAFVAELKRYAKLEPVKPLDFATLDCVIGPESDTIPKVSILVPVYNQSHYTFNCLKSIYERSDRQVTFEIIAIDDASSDETEVMLQTISGIRVLRNPDNLGFIRSCNRGLAAARGELVWFLNNDTQLLPGCLTELVAIYESRTKDGTNVGAVGSKLIYANGQLQEAGGIIWQDASGCNFGRLDSPQEPQYNYVRPVDYCSGASLLINTELMRSLGGFSEEFLPAYYEDTDLCFRLRDRGYDVLYQPASQLIHYEGMSSGTDESSGVKRHQAINRDRFAQKWQQVLAGHDENVGDSAPFGARRLCRRPLVLVIDSYVPAYDRESGSCRLFHILNLLLELGCTPIFLPDNGLPEEPYTRQLQQLGIEVLYTTPQQPDLLQQLRDRLPLLDLAWICRPQLSEKYLPVLESRPDLATIYDTIDLHFVRMQRQEHYQPSAEGEPSWQQMKQLELAVARQTDATVVVTDIERKLLQELGIERVHTVPNIHVPFTGESPGFERRQGLLFIGGYNHVPNVDAVVWFCQDIAPLIWQEQPDMMITLLGSNPPDVVQQLASDRVKVTGYIADVEPYFLQARVFVSPLRYGAGMKGKIGHSLSYGLPVVTTAIGAEGMGLQDGRDVLVREEPAEFAQAVLDLYRDTVLWEQLSARGFEAIAQFGPESLRPRLQDLLEQLLPESMASQSPLGKRS